MDVRGWYLLFGYPGSGKGTQARLAIAGEMNNKGNYICTGDDLRDALPGSLLYRAFKECNVGGANFAPDEIMYEHVLERITKKSTSNGTIFDGFPRNLTQCKMFDGLLKRFNKGLSIIYFDVPRDVALKRLTKRATIEGREDDNTLEKREKRLDTFERVTLPVLDYYSSRKGIPIYVLDGNLPVENIQNQLLDILSGRIM